MKGLKGLEFIFGVAVCLLIIFNIDKLKLKDGLIPAVLLALGLAMALIGYSEKIMFLSVAGTFISLVSGYLFSTQIMILLGINEVAAYFLGFVIIGIIATSL